MEDRPLATALSPLLVALTIEVDNEFEHRMPHRTAAGSGGRAGRPYASRTLAMLRDPFTTLPHYPMVLHRGG